jgi:hypothetical protein
MSEAGPNRSAIGTWWPKAISEAWTRFLRIARCLTKCSRHRERSRSARSSGVGSQIAGTRSRNDNSASTRASIWSEMPSWVCLLPDD